MNWYYLAGLFDGEGSVTLGRSSDNVVRFSIVITTSHEETIKKVRAFLAARDISTGLSKRRNPLGSAYAITIAGWGDAKRFCDAIHPFLVEKAPHVALAKTAIKLHDELRLEGKDTMRSHVKEFDTIRRALHALAHKGPKHLKAWN